MYISYVLVKRASIWSCINPILIKLTSVFFSIEKPEDSLEPKLNLVKVLFLLNRRMLYKLGMGCFKDLDYWLCLAQVNNNFDEKMLAFGLISQILLMITIWPFLCKFVPWFSPQPLNQSYWNFSTFLHIYFYLSLGTKFQEKMWNLLLVRHWR